MQTIRWLSVAVCLALATACQAQPQLSEGEAGPAGPPGPASGRVSPSTASASPTSTAPLTLGPDGIGQLKLSMTRAQAEASGMVDGFIRPPSDDSGCPWRTSVKHASGIGGTVLVSMKLGVAAIDAAGSIKTPEGIGLGSSLADVRRAYAGFTPDPDTGRGYPTVPGNSGAVYRISIHNDAVNALTLQLRNQDCYE